MRFTLLSALFLSFCAYAEDAPPVVFLNDGDNTGVLQAYAGTELQGYFSKLFSNPIVTESTPAAEFHVLYGSPENNPGIREALAGETITLPEGPQADQGYALKSVDKTVYIASHTEQGVLYGVYALLEAYGAYFQISGERLPEQTSFHVIPLDRMEAPAFKYRGLLPWDNFLCGMSGYNLEDYQLLIDRAVRMRLNFLQFHFYPGMAFFTETVDGVRVTPTAIGIPVDVFPTAGAAGEAAFDGEAVFGPRPYVENAGNPAAQADAVQAMMRAVLDHAHARGMRTCVGFELMTPPSGNVQWTDKPDGGANCLDPLRPENLQISLQRYRSLVETYPQSDYYWMWQSEARGVLGRPVGVEPGAGAMRAEYARWTPLDTHAGDIDYAYHFRDLVNALTPEERARIATGGWFVQHLFPGLHPDFPPEIRFASLNTYDPEQTVNGHLEYYQPAQQGRPTWMIDWWEFDGEQWFPQWRVTWQERMYRKCLEQGVEAVTLLGWKLSGIEHNIRYLAEFCWNPELSANQFYGEYVRRLYGQDAAPLKGIYLAYDAMAPHTPPANPYDDRPMLLAPGWAALGFPAFPDTLEGLNTESWQRVLTRSGEIVVEQQALLEKDREAIAAIGLMIPGLDAQGQSWAALLLNRLRMRAHYLESMMALNRAYGVFHKQASTSGLTEGRSAAAGEIQQAVDLARQCIELYAKDARNRNDLGVVAQMNVQYLQVLLQLQATLAAPSETPLN